MIFHSKPILTRNDIRVNARTQHILFTNIPFFPVLYEVIGDEFIWMSQPKQIVWNLLSSKIKLAAFRTFWNQSPTQLNGAPIIMFLCKPSDNMWTALRKWTFCMATMCDITRLQCQIFMPIPRERQRTGMKTKSYVQHVYWDLLLFWEGRGIHMCDKSTISSFHSLKYMLFHFAENGF